jgi:hypothetical protein
VNVTCAGQMSNDTSVFPCDTILIPGGWSANLKLARTGFWETKAGLPQSLWTFSNPQPNPQYAMSCTTSA